ncbi:MAG TPA: hypothetical protein VHA77_01060 [Xanthobacteraceae bacterium]|nr:hypothetical protein [Xanthobacteraceae bacterium]
MSFTSGEVVAVMSGGPTAESAADALLLYFLGASASLGNADALAHDPRLEESRLRIAAGDDEDEDDEEEDDDEEDEDDEEGEEDDDGEEEEDEDDEDEEGDEDEDEEDDDDEDDED